MNMKVVLGILLILTCISSASADTFYYDSLNETMTDTDGLQYKANTDGVVTINDNRYLAFALKGTIGVTEHTKTSMNYTWTWHHQTDGTNHILWAENNDNQLIWEQYWYFYEDPDVSMEIHHYLKNNLSSAPITDMQLFYMITVDDDDVIKYNGSSYVVGNVKPLHIEKDLTPYIPKINFNSEYDFNFTGLIDNGFDVNEFYIGSGSVIGASGVDITAIGFTKNNGVLPAQASVWISPRININSIILMLDSNKIMFEDPDITISTTYLKEGAGYVYPTFTYKNLPGGAANVDIAFGVNESELRFISGDYWSPYQTEWNTYHNHYFYNVSMNGTYSNEVLDYGNSYNTHQYIIDHDVSNESEVVERMTSNISFDTLTPSPFVSGEDYVVVWHTEHSGTKNWKPLPENILTVVNQDYNNKNKWYMLNNIPVVEDVENRIRVYMEVAQEVGEHSYKYDIATKLSSDTLSEAVANDRLKIIDPYGDSSNFNSTWNTSLTSVGSTNSTSIKLPLEAGGTYNFQVWWGDGSNDTITVWNQANVTHNYASQGTYDVVISGTIQGFRFANTGDKLKLIDISNWGDLNVGNNDGYFFGCTNFNSTATDALDLTGTTDMIEMFRSATSFNGNIDNWDTSAVTHMDHMFQNALIFNQDINNWDTSNVLQMHYMFYNAQLFNGNISEWNTLNVTTMNHIFYNAHDFNQPIGNWNVSNIVFGYYMFYNAYDFNQDIGAWDTSSATAMDSMFYNARAFNQDINTWDVSSVTSMRNMFFNAYDFNQDLNSWDTSSTTTMKGMFFGATSFNGNVSNWDITSLTSTKDMFRNTPFNHSIENWDMVGVTTIYAMFYGNTEFNQSLNGWDTSTIANMQHVFYGANKFNQNLSNWDTSGVTKMDFMFHSASVFNGNITTWDTSKVIFMNSMFFNTYDFNQDIGNWNTSKVTTFNSMFYRAYDFNQDISAWDTAACTNMYAMFYQISIFNQDLGNWNVSKVTNMQHMLTLSTLSTSNYDSLLVGWSSLPTLVSSVTFTAGNAQYTATGQAGRNILTGAPNNWVITDGGLEEVINPPLNVTSVIAIDHIHFDWDDDSNIDYWNVSQRVPSLPYTDVIIVLDGVKDAEFTNRAHTWVGDSPNPSTAFGKEEISWIRNSTTLSGYADGEDNDNLPNDDTFEVMIDFTNNNLTTDDLKYILHENGAVSREQWSGSAWNPAPGTTAAGVVIGGGVAGPIQYEMQIPISELTNFDNCSTIKFAMKRVHSGSSPDIESYYPQNLINDTDATLWEVLHLSAESEYIHINTSAISQSCSCDLEPFTWYRHKIVSVKGPIESAPVYTNNITLDNPVYSVSGYIKDPSGNAISGAHVWAQNGYVQEANTSNATGYYEGTHFHNASYKIYASATDYITNYTPAVVSGNNLTNVNVTLPYLDFEINDDGSLTIWGFTNLSDLYDTVDNESKISYDVGNDTYSLLVSVLYNGTSIFNVIENVTLNPSVTFEFTGPYSISNATVNGTSTSDLILNATDPGVVSNVTFIGTNLSFTNANATLDNNSYNVNITISNSTMVMSDEVFDSSSLIVDSNSSVTVTDADNILLDIQDVNSTIVIRNTDGQIFSTTTQACGDVEGIISETITGTVQALNITQKNEYLEFIEDTCYTVNDFSLLTFSNLTIVSGTTDTWNINGLTPGGTYLLHNTTGVSKETQIADSNGSVTFTYNMNYLTSTYTINSYTPTDLTPTVPETTAIGFTVNTVTNANHTWYKNSTPQYTNASVSSSQYNISSAEEGIWNITVVTESIVGPPGSDSVTWILNVTPLYPDPISNLQNYTGNFWINWTFDAAANASLYNIWINNVDTDNTTNLYYNHTASAHDTVNISIRTYNDTWDGLSGFSTWVNDTVTIPNNLINITNTSNYMGLDGVEAIIDFDYTDLDGDTGSFQTNATVGSLNSTTGVFNWMPTLSDVGTHYFEFNVSDGHGSVDSYISQFVIYSATPTDITGLTNITSVFHSNWSWDASTYATEYQIIINETLEINTSNLFYNYTASPHEVVNFSIRGYNASTDIYGNWTNESITIPNNPVTDIEAIADMPDERELFIISIDVNSSDIDNDILTYGINRSDLFTDFNSTTGKGNWTPQIGDAGTYQIEVNVTDGYGSNDTESFEIVVAEHLVFTNKNPLYNTEINVGGRETYSITTSVNTTSEWNIAGEVLRSETGIDKIFTTPDDLAIGTYVVQLIANSTIDSLVNDSEEWSLSVTATPVTGGGSPRNGGVPSGAGTSNEPLRNVECKESGILRNIKYGVEISYDVKDTNCLKVVNLSFIPTANSRDQPVYLETLKSRSVFVTEDVPGYKIHYFNLFVGLLGYDSKTEQEKINFKLKISGIEEANLEPESMKLYKWSDEGETWIRKYTELTGVDEEFYYYASDSGATTGYFAISGREAIPEVIKIDKDLFGFLPGLGNFELIIPSAIGDTIITPFFDSIGVFINNVIVEFIPSAVPEEDIELIGFTITSQQDTAESSDGSFGLMTICLFTLILTGVLSLYYNSDKWFVSMFIAILLLGSVYTLFGNEMIVLFSIPLLNIVFNIIIIASISYLIPSAFNEIKGNNRPKGVSR